MSTQSAVTADIAGYVLSCMISERTPAVEFVCRDPLETRKLLGVSKKGD